MASCFLHSVGIKVPAFGIILFVLYTARNSVTMVICTERRKIRKVLSGIMLLHTFDYFDFITN